MKIAALGRYRVGLWIVVAMLTGCGGSHSPNVLIPEQGGATNAASGSRTFYYTGGEQSFKVPTSVTQITVVARGGAGAGSDGKGGRVYAIIPVKPGEKLDIFVGGAASKANGGFNGGANGGIARYSCHGCDGRGGGGASDIRLRGDALSDRILVAAGGGGAGGVGHDGGRVSPGSGGKGGGKIGGSGGDGYSPPNWDSGGDGGLGGTQSSGGSGGAGGLGIYGSTNGHPGNNGSLGDGGNGGAPGGGYGLDGAGGGGGGGYYGGGGGGGGGGWPSSGNAGGGGGGGSSYVEPSAITFRMWSGWKNATGNGLVVFSWK